MSATIYDSDRIGKIAQIVPKFSELAQPGDTVDLGLMGDPSFPEKYRSSRPSGTVTRVENNGQGRDVHIKLSNGTSKIVSDTTIDPMSVWEFTDASFQNVLERQQPPKAYRGRADPAPAVNVEAIHTKLHSLASKLQQSDDSNVAFRNTVITTLSAVAKEVSELQSAGKYRGGSHATTFCTTLAAEYSGMVNRSDSTYRGTNEAMFSSDSDAESD